MTFCIVSIFRNLASNFCTLKRYVKFLFPVNFIQSMKKCIHLFLFKNEQEYSVDLIHVQVKDSLHMVTYVFFPIMPAIIKYLQIMKIQTIGWEYRLTFFVVRLLPYINFIVFYCDTILFFSIFSNFHKY